jgi:hypothetical protein
MIFRDTSSWIIQSTVLQEQGNLTLYSNPRANALPAPDMIYSLRGQSICAIEIYRLVVHFGTSGVILRPIFPLNTLHEDADIRHS